MQLTLIHLLLIMCIIKFVSLYTDSKFLAMSVVLLLALYYLYSSNKISFDVKMFENVSKDKLFEEKLQKLNNITNELTIFSFNNELKQNIITKLTNFSDNLSVIYYNKVKYCTYYIDVLLQQKNDILNIARSYIITATQLESYTSLEKEMTEFQNLIENIFNDVTIKCPEYTKIKFMAAQNYSNSHSFQQY